MGHAANGHAAKDDLTHLLVESVRRTNVRVDEAFEQVHALRSDMEAGRREDVNRLADKIERGFERVASDAKEREARLNERLDRMDDKLVDVCDKGRQDHNRFDGQYTELRGGLLLLTKRLDETDIRKDERRRIADGFRATGEFLVEHGKDIFLVGGVITAITLGLMSQGRSEPVTVRQETLSHGQDASLRLDFSDAGTY